MSTVSAHGETGAPVCGTPSDLNGLRIDEEVTWTTPPAMVEVVGHNGGVLVGKSIGMKTAFGTSCSFGAIGQYFGAANRGSVVIFLTESRNLLSRHIQFIPIKTSSLAFDMIEYTSL